MKIQKSIIFLFPMLFLASCGGGDKTSLATAIMLLQIDKSKSVITDTPDGTLRMNGHTTTVFNKQTFYTYQSAENPQKNISVAEIKSGDENSTIISFNNESGFSNAGILVSENTNQYAGECQSEIRKTDQILNIQVERCYLKNMVNLNEKVPFEMNINLKGEPSVQKLTDKQFAESEVKESAGAKFRSPIENQNLCDYGLMAYARVVLLAREINVLKSQWWNPWALYAIYVKAGEARHWGSEAEKNLKFCPVGG